MLPTFAELGGAKLPEGLKIDGRSLAPQLRGEKGTPREWAYVQLGAKWFVREQGWKMNESGELFDMSDAPFVEKPVAASADTDVEQGRARPPDRRARRTQSRRRQDRWRWRQGGEEKEEGRTEAVIPHPATKRALQVHTAIHLPGESISGCLRSQQLASNFPPNDPAMSLPIIRFFARSLSTLAIATLCSVAAADDLETGFRTPPHSAGIRSFWWWLNGNVTAEAITRDLEEMKAKGYSGALIFDADGSGQRNNNPVPAGPAFGSPAWTKLFVHACKEAKRLDLELSLNIQSGWNLGGPEVTEEQTTQHLVWSRTTVEGPGAVEMMIAESPSSTRFFRDVVVLAVPLGPGKPTPDR